MRYHKNSRSAYSLVYGENNDKGVIYHFVNDIKKKGYITIAGDGNQSRNFLHITDACIAIEKALLYNKTNVFNIANTQKLTVNDVVAKLQAKYTFTIKHKSNDNDLKDLLLDTIKAQSELGFTANVNELIF